MNIRIVKSYIEEYKKQFEYVDKQEIYKWQAVKHFQDSWDIDADNFYSMISSSLEKVSNLQDSGQYFPKRMLLKNSELAPERVRGLFKNLYNEEVDIYKRIEAFQSGFNDLNNKNFKDKKSYQDPRAVIVYLTLHFPERYYFYKYEMFKSFVEKVGISYKPIAGRLANIGKFNNYCDRLRDEISKDQELLKLHKKRITDDCYFDENLHILTQDFIYAVVRHLDNVEIEENRTVSLNATEINSSDISVAENEIKNSFTPRTINYLQNNIENKRIGDLGELWVIEREKQKLLQINEDKLAKKVSHVAKEVGDGLGYDVLSFDENGSEIYIEVKTTKGSVNTPYFITSNELEKSIVEQDSYQLYRVFAFNDETNSADLLIIKGNLSTLCKTPVAYKVKMLMEKRQKNV